MNKLFFLLFLLLLVGCTRTEFVLKEVPVVEKIYVEVPEKIVYVNRTVYVNQTIDRSENVTSSLGGNCTNNSILYVASRNDTYTIQLIRQLKWCERRISYNATFYKDLYLECEDKLNNITSLLE